MTDSAYGKIIERIVDSEKERFFPDPNSLAPIYWRTLTPENRYVELLVEFRGKNRPLFPEKLRNLLAELGRLGDSFRITPWDSVHASLIDVLLFTESTYSKESEQKAVDAVKGKLALTYRFDVGAIYVANNGVGLQTIPSKEAWDFLVKTESDLKEALSGVAGEQVKIKSYGEGPMRRFAMNVLRFEEKVSPDDLKRLCEFAAKFNNQTVAARLPFFSGSFGSSLVTSDQMFSKPNSAILTD